MMGKKKISKRSFERLVKEADSVLFNTEHPLWKPGTKRLLKDVRRGSVRK